MFIYNHRTELLEAALQPTQTLECKSWRTDTYEIAELLLESLRVTADDLMSEDGGTARETFNAHSRGHDRGPKPGSPGTAGRASGGRERSEGRV
ncbi:Uu.00g004490.m01.CDS01 [Anthostomella pinea]|uniref:Uu.00g004490.m01.CDS01 n=1 Tax=Anthostomella pinea TaxID=933095 RepID=A0AAI8VJZ8_9PEZI|nr:Uu.00g004490.m01.CDS01 [Anthostomella pinea]